VTPEEPTFEGIPYSSLPIDTVDWEHRGDYIRSRSLRKGSTEFDVEPEWATEAALDRDRLVGPGTSSTSVEIVGWSASAPARLGTGKGRVLKVWLVPKDHPPRGDWWGANACDGNQRDRRDYENGRVQDE
jgi:hypothetical protein